MKNKLEYLTYGDTPETFIKTVNTLIEHLKALEDKIHFLENVEPYDPEKDEKAIIDQIMSETLYKEDWY